MTKRIPATDFEIRLRAWQKAKNFVDKEAAEFLGVNVATYRHWIYSGIVPTEVNCKTCIERKLNEA